MDPNNQNPQGDGDAVKKLEQDLQNLTQQAAATGQTPAPAAPPAPLTPSVPEVPPVAPVIPPTSAAPAETNVLVPEMPKKGSPLLIVAIILALVAVLAVVAYVFGAKLLAPQPTPIPVAVVTPSATPDVTANWQTYSNIKYNFSFKYPSDWAVLDSFGGPLMIAPTTSTQSVSKTLSPSIPPEGGKPLISFLSITEGEGAPIANQYWNIVQSTIQVDNTTVNKYTETNIKATPNGKFTVGDVTTTVLIPLQNNIVIDYSLLDQNYSTIFDQILSTFKYSLATSAASPTASPTASSSSTPTATP